MDMQHAHLVTAAAVTAAGSQFYTRRYPWKIGATLYKTKQQVLRSVMYSNGQHFYLSEELFLGQYYLKIRRFRLLGGSYHPSSGTPTSSAGAHHFIHK